MIWLSSSAIARLRDRLQAHGRRPSIVSPEGSASPEEALTLNTVAEYGPLCEAMYLMMNADGDVGTAEREVLKGALRNLSGDVIRGAQIDSMLADAEKRVATEGRDARMKDVAAALHEDKPRAEVAFVLAAAIAFADSAIADEENDTLNSLADALGIDETRANELLDDVEKDLAGQGAETQG